MTIFYETTFVEIDLLLRRGAHINRSNLVAYDYMRQNFEDLQSYYENYGCTLHQHPDGFFYMAIKNAKFRTRLLPKSCVHLGIFIALKARDPEITRSLGRISINTFMQDIETSIPKHVLQQVYAPNRRDAVVDEAISDEIKRSLKTLADLEFIEISDTVIRPLEAINRFAELARFNNDPDENSRLVLTERGIVFNSSDENEEYEDGLDER